MKIKHYLYNAFLIEDGKTKIAIDPGQSCSDCLESQAISANKRLRKSMR